MLSFIFGQLASPLNLLYAKCIQILIKLSKNDIHLLSTGFLLAFKADTNEKPTLIQILPKLSKKSMLICHL